MLTAKERELVAATATAVVAALLPQHNGDHAEHVAERMADASKTEKTAEALVSKTGKTAEALAILLKHDPCPLGWTPELVVDVKHMVKGFNRIFWAIILGLVGLFIGALGIIIALGIHAWAK